MSSSSSSPSKPPSDSQSAAYTFPSPTSFWTSHPPLHFRMRFLNRLQQLFNIAIPVWHTASFIPVQKADVYEFLAHEALHLHAEPSLSDDVDAMAVLTFTRLHHLNLHGFAMELEGELARLCESGTTDREQMGRVRGLLREYCQAIKDHEYLTDRQFKPTHNPTGIYPFHETLLPTLHARLQSAPSSHTHMTSFNDNYFHPIQTPYSTWSSSIISKLWGGIFGGVNADSADGDYGAEFVQYEGHVDYE